MQFVLSLERVLPQQGNQVPIKIIHLKIISWEFGTDRYLISLFKTCWTVKSNYRSEVWQEPLLLFFSIYFHDSGETGHMSDKAYLSIIADAISNKIPCHAWIILIWVTTWQTNKMGVHQVKTPISQDIHPVWSEFLLRAQWVTMDQHFLYVDSQDAVQIGLN